MYKNKSPYSHHHQPPQQQQQPYQSRSPLGPAHQTSAYMFSQTLAHFGNKNKGQPTQAVTGHVPNNLGGFAVYRKNNQHHASANNNTSNGAIANMDLGCDQVLSQNKPDPHMDIDFTCNQSLIPVSKHSTSPNPVSMPVRRLQQRHASSNTALPALTVLDLKCDEQLTQKQNKQNELVQIRRRVEAVLEQYQRVMLQQQEKINKLESEKESLLRIINMGN